MVEAALVGLAMAGATTLVAAMATDAWQATRDGVLGLFHRDGQAQQVALLAQADGNAARVEQCEDRDSARQRLIPLWQGELEEFLSRHPDAAADLRSLTQRVRAQLPETQLSWVQNVTASGGGHAYGAQGPNSSVQVHHASPGHVPPSAPPSGTESDV